MTNGIFIEPDGRVHAGPCIEIGKLQFNCPMPSEYTGEFVLRESAGDFCDCETEPLERNITCLNDELIDIQNDLTDLKELIELSSQKLNSCVGDESAETGRDGKILDIISELNDAVRKYGL